MIRELKFFNLFVFENNFNELIRLLRQITCVKHDNSHNFRLDTYQKFLLYLIKNYPNYVMFDTFYHFNRKNFIIH